MPRPECAHATGGGHLVGTMFTIVTAEIPTSEWHLRKERYYWGDRYSYYKNGNYTGMSTPNLHFSDPIWFHEIVEVKQALAPRLTRPGVAQRYIMRD